MWGWCGVKGHIYVKISEKTLVGATGFEPVTSSL